MFNDFKRYHFDTVKNKIQKLKDIFDRLNLFALEKRYSSLFSKITALSNISETVKDNLDENAYVVVHAHNPEGFEIGGLVYILREGIDGLYQEMTFDISLAPKFYIDNKLIGYTATSISDHHKRIKLSDYGIKAGIHICKVIFNDITNELTVNISKNNVATVTFNFSRIDMPLTYDYDQEYIASISTATVLYKAYLPLYPFSPFAQIDNITYPITHLGEWYRANYTFNKTNFDYFESVSLPYSQAYIMLRLLSSYWPTLPLPPFDPGHASPSIPSTPMSINISSQSEFTNWWCQGLQLGNYPTVQLMDYDYAISGFQFPLNLYTVLSTRNIKPNRLYPSDPDLGIFNDNNPKFSSLLVPANINYKSVFFNAFTTNPVYQHLYSANTPDIEGNFQLANSMSGQLLNGGLRISSIPYDVLGTAF